MLKHKGGALQTWNSDGTPAEVIHYGPGLDKPCKDCKQSKGNLCRTKSGKPLNKSHVSRLG